MPIVYFKCSKCKAIRDTYEDAERCEKAHFSAISIKELEYRFGSYPFRVSMTFPDGQKREYQKVD